MRGEEKRKQEKELKQNWGPFMSASKGQVRFLQLAPGSFLWPGHMPDTAAAELEPKVP